MNLFFFGLSCSLAGALVSAGIFYHLTQGVNGKWWTLGMKTGESHGKAEVMQQLCRFAQAGKPPSNVDYFLDVKASRLSVIKQADSVKLYCE